MEWNARREGVAELGERVAVLLREVPAGSTRVRGLDWTVGELGAHLVTAARRQVAMAEGADLGNPYAGESRQGMVDRNAEEIADLDVRDPDKLAAMFVAENSNVLNAYGPDETRALRWFDVSLTVGQASAVWLGELLVHGFELARTLRRPWRIERDEATAVFEGLQPVLPVVVDRAVARRTAGTLHVHLRGNGDYTYRVDSDGTVEIERGRPERADLHISADPVANLLVGYGRRGPWWPVLTGRIFAWGRKPHFAMRFPKLFVNP